MKRYDVGEFGADEHPEGDWFPADVAQQLYSQLKWIRDNYPHRGPDGYPNLAWLEKTNAALSAADGEDQ